MIYKAVKTFKDRQQNINGCKNDRRWSTSRKRLWKRTTIVYKVQTAVKTGEKRLQGTNVCKKRPTIVYKAQTAVKTSDDGPQGSKRL